MIMKIHEHEPSLEVAGDKPLETSGGCIGIDTSPAEAKASVPAGQEFGENFSFAPKCAGGFTFGIRSQEGRTESAFAAVVAAQNRHRLRYVNSWGKFIAYESGKWKLDDGPIVDRIIRDAARKSWAELGDADEISREEIRETHGFIRRLNSANGKNAVRNLLPSDPGIAVAVEDLDSNSLLFNVRNGVIDLRTGTLLPHDPELMLSKISLIDFDPTATCPLWQRFLNEVFDDSELVSHMQKIVGYLLSACVHEHKLFILWGTGANGKSTFVETLLALLGEYGTVGAPDLLMQKGDAHPTEIAALFGNRLVVCSETDEGRKLAEARVKLLTGGDMLAGRRMREDFWTFRPSHKLMLCTNHKPELRGTDGGIRRRLHLIPFLRTFTPDKQDKELGAKLRSELGGILNWAVQGAKRWQIEGLGDATAVREATAAYIAGQDTIGRFLDEACSVASWERVRASNLYDAYRNWCESQGEPPFSMKRLGQSVEERGYRKRASNGIWYDGLGLKTTTATEGLE